MVFSVFALLVSFPAANSQLVALLQQSMRLTADMIARSPAFLNPLKDRELDLRGACSREPAGTEAPDTIEAHPQSHVVFRVCSAGNKIAVVENLAATQDQFDSIDLSDNEIGKIECMGA